MRSKYNKNDTLNLFLTCKSISEFNAKYTGHYQASLRFGWIEYFVAKSGIKRLKNTYSFDDCLKAASKCESKIEFSKTYKSLYQFATKRKWLQQIYSEIEIFKPKYTFEICQIAAAACSSKGEFSKNHRNIYLWAKKEKILDKITSHMPKSLAGGFSKSDFVNKCKNKSAVFYIIKCRKGKEWFYKIGITSNSLKERYKDSKRMPYKYCVIKEIIDTPEAIFNHEILMKRKILKHHYNPSIPFRGSKTECFKCNKNNRILSYAI